MMTTDTLILGDLNIHHSAWYSSSTGCLAFSSATCMAVITASSTDADSLSHLLSPGCTCQGLEDIVSTGYSLCYVSYVIVE